MPKVFISHSSADSDFVEREIIAPLHQAGIATWYSKEDIRPKDIWEPRIRTALKECDWFLLAMSPRAAQSVWVQSELRWAMKHRFERIVPVLIEECDPYEFHLHLEGIQHIDFSREQERVQAKKSLIQTFPCVAPPKELTSPFTGMKFALIPAGSFWMGSPEDDEDASDDEKPRHRVTISRPFSLGVYEVTQGEYQRVMGVNPSYFSATGDGKDKVQGQATERLPVECVSWFDAVEFCNALSAKEGRRPYYKIEDETVTILGGTGYRLPTEAEWEYACRAPVSDGKVTKHPFGNDDADLASYAWLSGNSGAKTHPVGQKKANRWGLYDMQGNVWEWCQDFYSADYYDSSPATDPAGPVSASPRVYRGGSWDSGPRYCRPAYRYGGTPDLRCILLGCRLAADQ